MPWAVAVFGSASRREGEILVTLDGVERILTTDDLLICDATDRPIGLAGVMGGQNTEIGEDTTVIALETAWFEPLAIMRSCQREPGCAARLPPASNGAWTPSASTPPWPASWSFCASPVPTWWSTTAPSMPAHPTCPRL